MSKFTLLCFGTLVLLVAIFFGYSVNNSPPTEELNVTMSDSAKSARTTPTVSVAANSAPPASITDSEGASQTNPVARTSGTDVQQEPRKTSGIQKIAAQNQEQTDSPKEGPVEAATTPKSDEPDQSQSPIGLRLAPDVRLPVAAMPLNFHVSPVAKKAIDQIVKDYYRDLASSLPQNDSQGATNAANTDLIEESETGELTRVVKNGPAVDAARRYADYRFKALFGNAAYNRMTTNTLLEARTPVNPQE